MPITPTPAPHWRTGPFRELYDEVTIRLRDHASGIAGAPDSDDYQWFNYLIDGFEAEYQLWATNPRLRTYLRKADPLSRAGRVVLHTYLHICYDLPRVIANSYSLRNRPPWTRCKYIFTEAQDTFIEAFDACTRKSSVFGWLSILAIVLYRVSQLWSQSFASGMGNWALKLRNEAWDAGTNLARSHNRQRAEEDILRLIERHMHTILLNTRNPMKILTSLEFPPYPPHVIFGGSYRVLRSVRARSNKLSIRDESDRPDVIGFSVAEKATELPSIESTVKELLIPKGEKRIEPEETIE